MLALRRFVAGVATLALGLLLLAGSAAGAPADHGPNRWAGQWTTSTGGVAFYLMDAGGIANAKTEGRHEVLFDKLPCKGGPQFYRGGYTNPNGDKGKVIACGTPTQLSGRWSSNVQPGNDGSFTISTGPGKPPRFRGTAVSDGGQTFPWTGTWQSHFTDDGCCERAGTGGTTPTCAKPSTKAISPPAAPRVPVGRADTPCEVVLTLSATRLDLGETVTIEARAKPALDKFPEGARLEIRGQMLSPDRKLGRKTCPGSPCTATRTSTGPAAIEYQAIVVYPGGDVRSDVVRVEWTGSQKLSFTYTVPDRFWLDENRDGLVDERATIDEVQPRIWPVDLKIRNCPQAGPDGYEWTYTARGVTSALLTRQTARCAWRAELPGRGSPNGGEGAYQVSVKAKERDGQRHEGSAEVVVQDWLLIGLGDSMASGEGNPALGRGASARWQNPPDGERCDRSVWSHQALAGVWLERADPKTSVTFVHLACSGAAIVDHSPGNTIKDGGLLQPYTGMIEGASPAFEPQVDVAKRLALPREIDAILLSAGVNDLEFGSVVKFCSVPVPASGGGSPDVLDCFGPKVIGKRYEDSGGTKWLRLTEFLETRLREMPRAYASLSGALGPFNAAGRVYITDYPPLLNDGQTTLCRGRQTLLYLRDTEITNMETLFRAPLNREVATAAKAHGWHLVPVGRAFADHGVCTSDPWVVSLDASRSGQGNANGTLHPNREGHRFMGGGFYRLLRAHLYPGGKPRPPR